MPERNERQLLLFISEIRDTSKQVQHTGNWNTKIQHQNIFPAHFYGIIINAESQIEIIIKIACFRHLEVRCNQCFNLVMMGNDGILCHINIFKKLPKFSFSQRMIISRLIHKSIKNIYFALKYFFLQAKAPFFTNAKIIQMPHNMRPLKSFTRCWIIVWHRISFLRYNLHPTVWH